MYFEPFQWSFSGLSKHKQSSNTMSKGLIKNPECKYVMDLIKKYPTCQRHGSIPIKSNVIMLYMMHYITNINKASMPANCH